MAGLLDMFDNPDAALGLGLLAAAGPRADGAGFGARLMEGVQYGQQYKQQKRKDKLLDMQQQEAELKLADAKRQAEIEKWALENAPKYFRPSVAAQPAQFQDLPQTPQAAPAIASPMGLDPAQTRQLPPQQRMVSPAVPASPASFDQEGFLNAYAQKNPLAAMTLLQKDTAPVVVPEGGSLYTKNGTFLAMGNPKREKMPDALTEYAFAVSQGEKRTFTEWQAAQKRAGATNVSLSADKGFADVFAKGAAESLGTSRDGARAAASNLNTLNRIDGILTKGNFVQGPTSTFEVFGRQLGQQLGIGGKDNAEVLANTRQLIQGAANLAADGAAMLAKQGQITDGERVLISRAAGGDIDKMTHPEMVALSSILRKINAMKIQQHNASLERVDPKLKPFTSFYQVDMPATSMGVDDLVKLYGGQR